MSSFSTLNIAINFDDCKIFLSYLTKNRQQELVSSKLFLTSMLEGSFYLLVQPRGANEPFRRIL